MEKYSRQRESIKENIVHRYDHPTADMVYDDIRKIYPNISLGTVYRNLALLVSKGEIIKISTSKGADRFDGCTSPHYHFYCEKCGNVMDIELDNLFDASSIKSKKIPGKVSSYTIMLNGICNDCVND